MTSSALMLACCSAPQGSARPPATVLSPGPERGAPARVAHLTGGVGNRVVDSFDQIRAAVSGVQREVDDCYETTAGEGGFRENLMWNLDVSPRGEVVRVTLHYAEYHRGARIVPGTPGAALGACMERALGRMRIPGAVRPGWIRVRFES